jgi:integrase
VVGSASGKQVDTEATLGGRPVALRFADDAISLESLKDIRDKAIFSVLFYSWCRVSALINLTVADYYERGGTRWLRFQEKRGKEHEVPLHSKAKEALDLWLKQSLLASIRVLHFFLPLARIGKPWTGDAWIVGVS